MNTLETAPGVLSEQKQREMRGDLKVEKRTSRRKLHGSRGPTKEAEEGFGGSVSGGGEETIREEKRERKPDVNLSDLTDYKD